MSILSTVNLTADYIDVRDIIARVEELREEREDYDDNNGAGSWMHDCEDDASELSDLEAILDDLAGYGGDEQGEGDWYPVTLIRERAFVDHIEEMVKDCYGIPDDLPAFVKIDWEATADECRIDYSTVEIDGITYLYR